MDLLVVGASARAAVFSARRAGFSAGAIDRFADHDLAAAAVRCERADLDDEDAVIAAARSFPPAPWVYTGDLENRPGLVARLAAERPLWGHGPEVLRAVRDPEKVAAALRAAGLPALDVRRSPAGLACDGRTWLCKPLASAGGLGVEPLTERDPRPGPWYYQRRVAGRPISGLFLGRGDSARLLGVSALLVGSPHGRYAYRGNVTPWPVSPTILEGVRRAGEVLALAFGLSGLFGVDLVDDGQVAWTLEVNPRYTAAVEVVELATGRALLAEHRDAWLGRAVDRDAAPAVPPRHVGKLIVYAASACGWPEAEAEAAPPGTASSPVGCAVRTVRRIGPVRTADPTEASATGSRLVPDAGWFGVPEVADLPPPGTRFAAGDPVLTVLASGPTARATLRALVELRRKWAARLARTP